MPNDSDDAAITERAPFDWYDEKQSADMCSEGGHDYLDPEYRDRLAQERKERNALRACFRDAAE